MMMHSGNTGITIGVLLLFIASFYKGSALFTSKPESRTYFKIGESISLEWTFNPSVDPFYIQFGKIDTGTHYWKSILFYKVQTNTVIITGDKSRPDTRIDMYGQATLRINGTTANDTGMYDCVVDSKNAGFFYSEIKLVIKEESVSSSIKASPSAFSASATASLPQKSTAPLASKTPFIDNKTRSSSNEVHVQISSATKIDFQPTQFSPRISTDFTHTASSSSNDYKSSYLQNSMVFPTLSPSIDPTAGLTERIKVNSTYPVNSETLRISKTTSNPVIKASMYVNVHNVTMKRRSSAAQTNEKTAIGVGIPAGIFILFVIIAAIVYSKKRLARRGRLSPSPSPTHVLESSQGGD